MRAKRAIRGQIDQRVWMRRLLFLRRDNSLRADGCFCVGYLVVILRDGEVDR